MMMMTNQYKNWIQYQSRKQISLQFHSINKIIRIQDLIRKFGKRVLQEQFTTFQNFWRYGDISPQTDFEKIMVIIMSLITCQVFGYSINSIGQIIKDIEDSTKKQKIKISKITNYLQRKNISKSLQLKVIKYFEYMLKIQKEQDEDVQNLMRQLQPQLKSQVMQESFKEILKNSKFIRENLSSDCLDKLCSLVHEQKCQPGEQLYNIDDVCDRLYFLRDGQLNIVFDNQNDKSKVIKKLGKGYVLCEKNFLLNQRMFYKVQCEWFTDLIYIKYDDLSDLLKQFDKDNEKFHQIRENIFQYVNYVDLIMKCLNVPHEMSKCALCFYQPNAKKVIKQLTKNTKQKRNIFKRSVIKKLEYGLDTIQQQALAYLLNENLMNETELKPSLLLSLGFYEFLEDSINQESQGQSSPKQLNEETSIQFIPGDQSGIGEQQEEIKKKQPRKKKLTLVPNNIRRLSQDKKLMELFQQMSSSKNLELQDSNPNCITSQLNQINREDTKNSIQSEVLFNSLKKIPSEQNVNQELHIDKLKNYEIYFPEGNIDSIIQKLEEEQQSRNVSRYQSSKILQKIIKRVQDNLPRMKACSFQSSHEINQNRCIPMKSQ